MLTPIETDTRAMPGAPRSASSPDVASIGRAQDHRSGEAAGDQPVHVERGIVPRQIDVPVPARGGGGGHADVPATGADPLDVDDGEAFEGAGKGVLHVLFFGADPGRRIPHRR